MAKKRRRPNAGSMREGLGHSHDHRGSTGMYGNYFTKEIDEWVPSSDEHELAIIAYFIDCEENSLFRTANPDLNKPFTEEQLKAGDTWDHKLSIFTHRNIGPNKETVVCPSLTLKKPCPMCERRQELYEEKEELENANKNTKEIEKRISALNASKKALYNIVVFDSGKERKKGLQVWAAPHPSIEDPLASKSRNKKTGEITAFTILEENLNVYFEKEGTGLNTEYKDIELMDREEKDQFSEEEADDLYDNAINFEDIVEVKTYEQLAEMYSGIEKDMPPETSKETEEDEKESRRKAREARRNKKDDDEPEPKEEKKDEPEDDKEEPEPEEKSTGRKPPNREKKDEPKDEPEPEPEEKEEPEPEEETGGGDESGAPPCFKSAKFNRLDRCENCDDEFFVPCAEEADKRG